MVNAKPNSKINAITGLFEKYFVFLAFFHFWKKFFKKSGINDEAVDISVAAPAKDNEANTELLEYIGEVLGIKKTNISLDKGGKSRSKLFVLENSEHTASEIYKLLKSSLN